MYSRGNPLLTSPSLYYYMAKDFFIYAAKMGGCGWSLIIKVLSTFSNLKKKIV